MHTSESSGNFTKNGNKFHIGGASATVTPMGHPPSGMYRRNARAESAERREYSNEAKFCKEEKHRFIIIIILLLD